MLLEGEAGAVDLWVTVGFVSISRLGSWRGNVTVVWRNEASVQQEQQQEQQQLMQRWTVCGRT